MVQEMEGELAAKEAEKVAAQRDLHELQLQCRSGDSEGLVGFALPGTPHARHRGSGDATGDGDAVAHIVGDLEAAGVGARRPSTPPLAARHLLRTCTVLLRIRVVPLKLRTW